MSDIVERLRQYRPVYGWPEETATVVTQTLGDAAADEIERLRAEVARLEAEAEAPYASEVIVGTTRNGLDKTIFTVTIYDPVTKTTVNLVPLI